MCDGFRFVRTVVEATEKEKGACFPHHRQKIVSASLTKLDARSNMIRDEGRVALQKAVEARSGFELKLRAPGVV